MVILAAALAGCGRAPGPVFTPLQTPLRWPPPPEAARIEYVGKIETDRDLKARKSLGESLFGARPGRSMLSPYAVCTDAGDRVFVCDSNAQVVHVFDLASRRYERWPDQDGETTLAQPLGIAWDPQGRLLVADAVNACVVVLAGDGTVAGRMGEGLLSRPCGIAFDPARRRVLVADAAAHEIVVFDAAGRLRQRLGGRGVEPGRFNYPTNLAVDDAGRLYVADTLNFRVQVFDAELRPLRQIGSHGDLPGYFSQPKGVALDGEGHLYVVDAHFETVQIFDGEGRLLLTFGREGRGPGEFWLPAGIHIDPSDRIWIADSYNRRVQVFRYVAEAPE